MKKITLIVSIFFMFSSVTYSEENNCEDKKLVSKILCKSFGLGKVSSSKISNVEMDTSNIKEKKYISDWFKKKEWVQKKI